MLLDHNGAFSLNGTDFADASLKYTIKGSVCGNLPVMTIKRR